MKHLLLSMAFVPYILLAQAPYSFVNIGLNYNSWKYQDFTFVSAEYGAGWSWGEFYGNSNLQNPLSTYEKKVPNNLRFTMVNDFDIKLTQAFRVHFQDYHLQSKPYFVNDSVLGFSYKYIYRGLWFKPFIGVHYTYDTYFNGLNGYMSGWLINYRFSFLEQNFSLFQWNEIEFLRAKSFYEDSSSKPIGDAKSYGFNGAVKFFWHPQTYMTTGIEYRYSKYKRGSKEYLDAFIYTIKYNF